MYYYNDNTNNGELLLIDCLLVKFIIYNLLGGSCSQGKILQRFPETDWQDTPFIEGLELFCQPHGWRLTPDPRPPLFFTSVLTDVKASSHYCAILTFFEPSIHTKSTVYSEGVDDFDVPYDMSNNVEQLTMYAPKSLVLVSKHFYLKTLKNCLSLLYSAFVDESDIKLEVLVGNLLTCVEIPRGIKEDITFCLGSNDKHILKPVLSDTVPYTGTCVRMLFEDLGIHASILLFEAVMTENKILFHSRSYSRLHDACYALTSLMYPFKYSYVYIPVLPAFLSEVLSTPTPFVIGVHSSMKNEVSDILDVIIVDLDGGHIAVPDCIHIPRLDESTLDELLTLLCSVIRPSLKHADDAFQIEPIVPSPPHILDKEIRAIFLRLFTHLLSGYRQCLQSVRIHPKPYITFQKALFLGQRSLVDNEFIVRLLDSMCFNSFVQERGLPFRPVDLFDQLYSQLDLLVKAETAGGLDVILNNVRDIAHQLSTNEGQEYCSFNYVPNNNFGSRTFPELDSDLITQKIYYEQITKEIETTKPVGSKSENSSGGDCNSNLLAHPLSPLNRGHRVPQFVSIGPSTSLILTAASSATNSARRLEVMRNCIKAIFENRISDAKKTFPAVTRALKSNSACLSLAHELSAYVTGHKAQLDHQQFDLIVKLVNCSLQQESDSLGGTASGISGYEDVNGVASAMLPLATSLCRKLAPHVLQFAYTCLQDHPIWSNLSFWESTFYRDVSRDICALYSSDGNLDLDCNESNSVNHLDIVAKQLQLVYEGKLSENDLIEAGRNEERTVFSQAVHFANRIVYLKIPLDIGCAEKASRANLGTSGEGASDTNSNATEAWARDSWREGGPHPHSGVNLVAQSETGRDDESGFEEDRSGSNGNRHRVHSEAGNNAIKITAKFVDKVCSECDLPEDDIKSLHQMIPGLVAMQIETLEAVFRESKKLPPINKPKIVLPHLLPGEELTIEGLRVFLFPDGRDEVVSLVGKNSGSILQTIGPTLLPAEGAIFLTNYRIIFRGAPIDPFYAECSIVRSFPISTLTKEKRINLPSNYLLSTLDHLIHEGLQIRSNTFQMMRIAFDEEVSLDSIDKFKKLINKARCPSDVFTFFAFTSQVNTASQYKYLNQQKNKDKHSTLRNVAKKTLRKTAAIAHIPYKTKKNRKYLVQSIQSGGIRPVSPPESVDGKSSHLDSTYVTSGGTLVDTNLTNNSSSTRLPSNTLPPSVPTSLAISNASSAAGSGNASPHPPPHHQYTLKERDINEIHKLTEMIYFRDYTRMDLGSLKDIFSPSGQLKSFSSPKLSPTLADSFRISHVNINYGLVSSYPCFFVVPRIISDESLKKLSRGHRQARFPVITWKHPSKHSLLLRGSCFYGKGVTGMLRGHSNTTGVNVTGASPSITTTAGESSFAIEQEKYFRSLIKLTPSHFLRSNATSFSSTSPESPVHHSPLKRDSGSLLDSPRTKYNSTLEKVRSTLRSSGGKGSFGSFGTSVGKQFQKLTHMQSSKDKTSKSKQVPAIPPPPANYFATSSSNNTSNGSTNAPTPISNTATLTPSSPPPPPPTQFTSYANFNNSSKSSLYVIGEKSQVKGIHKDQFPNCDFIPVDIHEVKNVKQSFKKLIKACTPSVASADPDLSFYKLLRNSEWYTQIQTVMQVSAVIVDLLDLQGSSVMVCLEDGWDIVPQIVSIAQLCLDPYYRTFVGFRTLIEKEWLAFGHRFSHRSNHTAATLTSGFAPVFLQFLDIVHQIMIQFPLSFEFNEYFLKFLAYHYVSCRFRTFMLDSEQERAELGWLIDELRQTDDSLDELDYEDDSVSTVSASTTSATHLGPSIPPYSNSYNYDRFNYTGTSFWKYAESAWNKSAIFYNFLYVPTTSLDGQLKVLRPSHSLVLLEVWDYYCEEHLAYGFSYDLELVRMEKQSREENEATKDASSNDRNKSNRDICNSGYHSVIHQQPSSIVTLLDQLKKLESAVGSAGSQNSWYNIYDKTEIPMLSTTSLSTTAQNKSIDSLARLGCLSAFQGFTGAPLGSKVKAPSSFVTLKNKFYDQSKRTLRRNGTSGHVSPVFANAD